MEWTPAAFLCNIDRLWENLGSCGQRRLVFLLQSLSNAEPSDALELARQMECFVMGGAAGGPGSMSCGAVPEGASRDQAAAPEVGEPDGPEHLSRPVPREEFLSAIRAGATNHQLAEAFGLTLRQANGLRIGLARRKAQAPADVETVKSDRGEQGEALVGEETAPPEFIEEVVRFLRQTGDIVVRNGENYLVNARLILTMTELVERANRKRLQRGRSAFGADPPGETPPESQSAAPLRH